MPEHVNNEYAVALNQYSVADLAELNTPEIGELARLIPGMVGMVDGKFTPIEDKVIKDHKVLVTIRIARIMGHLSEALKYVASDDPMYVECNLDKAKETLDKTLAQFDDWA